MDDLNAAWITGKYLQAIVNAAWYSGSLELNPWEGDKNKPCRL